jgi:UPF0716 protein FxsA
MLRIVFLLFITIPLLELWILIEVGSGIGGISTIALCLLTAALGGFLIRWQGMSTLLDAQKRMAHGEIPADHGFHGLIIAFSGIMLFTPGFITDSIGFLLLVPPIRQLLINRFIPIPGQQKSDIINAEIIHDDKHIP